MNLSQIKATLFRQGTDVPATEPVESVLEEIQRYESHPTTKIAAVALTEMARPESTERQKVDRLMAALLDKLKFVPGEMGKVLDTVVQEAIVQYTNRYSASSNLETTNLRNIAILISELIEEPANAALKINDISAGTFILSNLEGDGLKLILDQRDEHSRRTTEGIQAVPAEAPE